MDDKEHIQLINDLVLKTEEGELTWVHSDYKDHFILNSDQGKISIGKKTSGDIEFYIENHLGAKVVFETYKLNSSDDLKLYKISNVLWLLVKDITRTNRVDLGEIMELLEDEVETDELPPASN